MIIRCGYCDQMPTRADDNGDPLCNRCARDHWGGDWRTVTRKWGVRAHHAFLARIEHFSRQETKIMSNATFAPAHPRVGDLIEISAGATSDWKAKFRMRVTEVLTTGNGKPLAAPIVGGHVVNLDGRTRMRNGVPVGRAFEYRDGMAVAMVEAATPSAETLLAAESAYKRREGLGLARPYVLPADQATCTWADRDPRSQAPVKRTPVPTRDQIIDALAEAVSAAVDAEVSVPPAGLAAMDTGRGDHVAPVVVDTRMGEGAARTAEETALLILDTVGTSTTLRWRDTNGDVSVVTGAVTNIDMVGAVVVVTLARGDGPTEVALLGCDTRHGVGTPYAIDRCAA